MATEKTTPESKGARCDTQNVQASFENGVLAVTLKAPPARARGCRVEIQDKASQPGGPVL